ncbi:MAG: DNA mismatch repair endonuclease MutL [Christensenellales bacterium]|jgi:DNA mismatch repair protein MutL
MAIQLLDEFISSKIAAGEVIERPSSIVKELIENAIDAECSSVTVEIQNGGISYLRVTDNGGGMSQQDAKLCFERHATSKIQSNADLNAIRTLGFRGEALHSIAAVSHVELLTRTKDSETGYRVAIQGGIIKEQGEVGCPEGTTLTVRNVFFNVPARLKFLKKVGIEAGYVGSMLAKQIMARPDIAFKYINNGKTIYFTSGNGKLYDSIYAVYGKDVSSCLYAVDYASQGIEISGFVGTPEIARSNHSHQSLYINGRYLMPHVVARAVAEAYDTRLMIHKHPFFVLHIQMPYQELDINVHPNKLEARFHEEAQLLQLVQQAVQYALHRPVHHLSDGEKPAHSATRVQTVSLSSNESQSEQLDFKKTEIHTYDQFPKGMQIFDTKTGQKRQGNLVLRQEDSLLDPEMPFYVDKPAGENVGNVDNFLNLSKNENMRFPKEELRIIGQVFATYILLERGEKLYLVDQHAAHERIFYERFQNAMNAGETLSQPLLEPVIIELTPIEKETVKQHLSLFKEIGFLIEEFGPLSYRISSVPFVMGQPQAAKAFFNEYLDQINSYTGRDAVAKKRERLIMLSCKKAVKAGDVLQDSELNALITHFEEDGVPATCPHGRPVITSLSKRDIEKSFGR